MPQFEGASHPADQEQNTFLVTRLFHACPVPLWWVKYPLSSCLNHEFVLCLHSSGTAAWGCPMQGRIGPNPWALVLLAPTRRFFSSSPSGNVALLLVPVKQRWGTCCEGQKEVASSLNLLAAEVLWCRGVQRRKASTRFASNLPLCAGAGLCLMLKPNSVRCSAPPPALAREQLSSEGCAAPWALLHGC